VYAVGTGGASGDGTCGKTEAVVTNDPTHDCRSTTDTDESKQLKSLIAGWLLRT